MRHPQLPLDANVDFMCRCKNEDGTDADLSLATEIKVAFTNSNRTSSLIGPISATSGYTSASWSTGLVPVPVNAVDATVVTDTIVCAVVRALIGTRYRVFLIDHIETIRTKIP